MSIWTNKCQQTTQGLKEFQTESNQPNNNNKNSINQLIQLILIRIQFELQRQPFLFLLAWPHLHFRDNHHWVLWLRLWWLMVLVSSQVGVGVESPSQSMTWCKLVELVVLYLLHVLEVLRVQFSCGHCWWQICRWDWTNQTVLLWFLLAKISRRPFHGHQKVPFFTKRWHTAT